MPHENRTYKVIIESIFWKDPVSKLGGTSTGNASYKLGMSASVYETDYLSVLKDFLITYYKAQNNQNKVKKFESFGERYKEFFDEIRSNLTEHQVKEIFKDVLNDEIDAIGSQKLRRKQKSEEKKLQRSKEKMSIPNLTTSTFAKKPKKREREEAAEALLGLNPPKKRF